MKRNPILILVFSSFLICILLAEVVLRIFGFGELRFRPQAMGAAPFVLRQLPQGRDIDWYFDLFSDLDHEKRKGLIIEGHYFPYERKDGVFRILCLGDSGTFGVGVKRTDAWPAQLENMLNSNGSRKVEVINFGIPGALLSDSLSFYQLFLRRYQADVVILGLFMANDINQSIYYKEEQRNITNSFERSNSNSAIVNFYKLSLYRLLSYEKFNKYFSSPTFLRNGLNLGGFEEGEFALYLDDEDALVERAYSNVESIFKRLASEVGLATQRLIIAAIPTRSFMEERLNILPFILNDKQDAHTFFQKEGLITSKTKLNFMRPYERVQEFSNSLNIEFADSYYFFKSPEAAVSLSESIFINEDDHLNSFGHKVLAKAISKKLSLAE